MSGVDTSGAMRKLARLQRAEATFANNILEDAGAFFQQELTGYVLNGAYVNRITGMLVRSQTLAKIQAGVRIFANLSIAPYAPDVAARTMAKYGKDYLRITKAYTEGKIKEGAGREFRRLGEKIDKDENYIYRNPYIIHG